MKGAKLCIFLTLSEMHRASWRGNSKLCPDMFFRKRLYRTCTQVQTELWPVMWIHPAAHALVENAPWSHPSPFALVTSISSTTAKKAILAILAPVYDTISIPITPTKTDSLKLLATVLQHRPCLLHDPQVALDVFTAA